MTIESRFDIPLIAELALREKQIQQNYRPIIAVHKWFARRPGTLFRGLLLSEFGREPLKDIFYRANDFPGKTIADPFMGGGTPLIEANRVGCDVIGFDINPMAAWIVQEEIEHLDLESYARESEKLIANLEREVGLSYRTDCPHFGDRNVPVKYFLWVKVLPCEKCAADVDLFPGYLLADDTRHPKYVLVCPSCGELNETSSTKHLGRCRTCSTALQIDGPAKRNRCACGSCGHVNSYPRQADGPPRHRMFAIEYHNPRAKAEHLGRFFKRPDQKDLQRVVDVTKRLAKSQLRFVPEQAIPLGDETGRLHRWGYSHYRDLFNDRQLLGLELSCRLIERVDNRRIKHALATNLSDLLRYQNILCRYDTMALKSLDIFSVHGFPVGLVQCESNILGLSNGNGGNVGSGGWRNIRDKYARAKRYCEAPFEIKHEGTRKTIVPIHGEWIGERSSGARSRAISIGCTDAARVELTPGSLDAVFTDPPYFGNVQYAELMDFCYVWLRRLVGTESEGFDRESTHSPEELTGNETQSRGLEHFGEGLSLTYRNVARALKPGAPLAFTFHHNRLSAYFAVGVALLDSGLTCSASIPCPGEMSGSIHIQGTASSIIDTVFVCRMHGSIRRKDLFDSANGLSRLVANDLYQLRLGGVKPTVGDTRCVAFGHLTRMAIWNLRSTWDLNLPIRERLARFADHIKTLGSTEAVVDDIARQDRLPVIRVAEPSSQYDQSTEDALTF